MATEKQKREPKVREIVTLPGGMMETQCVACEEVLLFEEGEPIHAWIEGGIVYGLLCGVCFKDERFRCRSGDEN